MKSFYRVYRIIRRKAVMLAVYDTRAEVEDCIRAYMFGQTEGTRVTYDIILVRNGEPYLVDRIETRRGIRDYRPVDYP